jgi:hypothetical protein
MFSSKLLGVEHKGRKQSRRSPSRIAFFRLQQKDAAPYSSGSSSATLIFSLPLSFFLKSYFSIQI